MHIFLDESGSFVTGPQRGSWCVVAAYVVPELRPDSPDMFTHALLPAALGQGYSTRRRSTGAAHARRPLTLFVSRRDFNSGRRAFSDEPLDVACRKQAASVTMALTF